VQLIVPAIGFGLIDASILAIAAVGFTLQFGVTNILNLAFASVMSLAAFAAWSANASGLNVWLALVVGIVVGMAASVLLNKYLYAAYVRRGQKAFGMIIVTFAVSIFLQYVIVLIWGNGLVSYRLAPGGTHSFLGMQFTTVQAIIVLIALVSMAAIHGLLRFTRVGKAMRAVAVNPKLAKNCGIRSGRVIDLAWALSGALGGLAGVVFAFNTTSFGPATHGDFLVVIVAAAVLGGIGQPYGAMLGAVVIGEVTELGALVVNPSFKNVIAFALLGIVLLIRPQGLLSGTLSKTEVAT
jgi:branched-subunit amino acid ABC-type transport system permease component